MANSRRAGIVSAKFDDTIYDVKGSVTYNVNKTKRDSIVGHDRYHGFKELPKVIFAEFAITDSDDFDIEADLYSKRDGTLVIDLANGKSITFSKAFFAGEGDVTTEEGEIAARFEAEDGQEIS